MKEKIESIINKIIENDAAPCVNYAVIHNNNIYKGSLGFQSKYGYDGTNIIDCIEKCQINSLFDLASLTKVVCTNTIIFKLLEQKRISLEDKIIKYLKDYKYDDITIYDLLTHTSGLEPDFRSKKIISYNESIDKIYSAERVIDKGSFLYSDVGYMLLGLIIEKIYNLPLDIVFQKEVAKPLNMVNTCFNPKEKHNCVPTEITKERGVIRGFVHDEKAYSMKGVAGHAGVFSTIDDLINFASMILNNGVFNNSQYLKKESIDRWYEPLVNKENYHKSFTWYVGNNPNVIMKNNVISFSGFTGTSISIDRINKIAIILLTNRIHPSRDNQKLIDIRAELHDEIYNYFSLKS